MNKNIIIWLIKDCIILYTFNKIITKIWNEIEKNKYLIKHKNQDQSKTNTINGKKSKFRIDLPLINFNKSLGSRKIEVKKFNAFITTSSFCSPYYNHRSYYMGENYNPNNYLLDYSKNRTKRNDFGSLFIN